MAEQLERVVAELREGRASPTVSVREFLSWFKAQRRGYWIVLAIRHELETLGLETVPDFEITYIGAPIAFKLCVPIGKGGPIAQEGAVVAKSAVAEGLAKDPALVSAMDDPTYRISKLAAANQPIVSIAPNGSLGEAVALLMANDFSQLPVMTGERDVKGVVTWKSLGRRLALSAGAKEARDVMVPHKEISSDSSIFEAIPAIISADYVLVRGFGNKIVGIITASDLSQQFLMTAEPFLLLGEIENILRRIIEKKFNAEDLRSAKDPDDTSREINVVSDLSFGEYIRLLDNDDRWDRLGLALDRKTVCQTLDSVRHIRNDVMHFDPDGIPDRDLNRLRDCASFLKEIRGVLGDP